MDPQEVAVSLGTLCWEKERVPAEGDLKEEATF